MGLESEATTTIASKSYGKAPGGAPTIPPPAFLDPEWAQRIAKALEARRAGQELRKGKPQGFATEWPIQLQKK